jgi:hypothetical protein
LETQNQPAQTISEQMNTPPTSPWTDWAESFVRAAKASNGDYPDTHHAANENNDPCDDALMDSCSH